VIEEFGSFSQAEVLAGGFSLRPRIAGEPVLGMLFDPARDIMWVHMARTEEAVPALAWVSDDPRLPVIAHLDDFGHLLSFGVGDASRLLPPALMLPGSARSMSLVFSEGEDAAQLNFIPEVISHKADVLTVQPRGEDGPSIKFVFEPSQLLVGVVITRVSELGHPTLLGSSGRL
jgi:hypothetical protein